MTRELPDNGGSGTGTIRSWIVQQTNKAKRNKKKRRNRVKRNRQRYTKPHKGDE